MERLRFRFGMERTSDNSDHWYLYINGMYAGIWVRSLSEYFCNGEYLNYLPVEKIIADQNDPSKLQQEWLDDLPF